MILAIGLFLGLAVFAQEKPMDKKMDHKMAMKDCVMMKDGKMMMARNGDTTMMEHNMTMSNGTMVMPDGICKRKDGKTSTMKNGDVICGDGKMMMNKKMMQMQHKM